MIRLASAVLVMVVISTCLRSAHAQHKDAPRVVHVIVALCDNEHQGIVKVPAKLGDGDDPANNLYWGALYGVKTHFKKSRDWSLVESTTKPSEVILERVIFRHKTTDTWLVAEAWRGRNIKDATVALLEAAAGGRRQSIKLKQDDRTVTLGLASDAHMLVYVGHDGLMDFEIDKPPKHADRRTRDVVILACMSRQFFTKPLQAAGARPLLWTTGLMAPEAYTLKDALDGWIKDETGAEIADRAARAYNRYQKCGLRGARRLLVTGYKTKDNDT